VYDAEDIELVEELPAIRIDYPVEELAVLAELLDVDGFPGVATGLEDLGDDAREAVLAAASRALLARGIVQPVDDGLEITAPHAHVLQTVLDPQRVLSVRREFEDDVETLAIYIGDTIAVEHVSRLGTIHSFTFFDPVNVEPRVQTLVGLDDRAAAEAGAVELPLLELGELEDALAAAEEVAPERAALAAALAGRVASFSVACYAEAAGGAIAGGELTWIDAGDTGYWTFELVEEGEGELTVRVAPASGDALLAELRGFLSAG
jgi:hypothetical protein